MQSNPRRWRIDTRQRTSRTTLFMAACRSDSGRSTAATTTKRHSERATVQRTNGREFADFARLRLQNSIGQLSFFYARWAYYNLRSPRDLNDSFGSKNLRICCCGCTLPPSSTRNYSNETPGKWSVNNIYTNRVKRTITFTRLRTWPYRKYFAQLPTLSRCKHYTAIRR